MLKRTLRSLAILSALFALAGVALPVLAEQSEWAIDAGHTRVGFSITHMVISEVDGDFKKFSGKALLDDKDLTKSSVEFSIDAASINTDNADRDKHLRSPEFFDVEKFPKLTFQSTKITKAGKGYKLKGNLTIHGVTKEVTLDALVSEPVANPWGKQVRGVKINGKVKREDFGLTWNKALDKGGVVLGNDVTINIKLELNK
jgi:polyisoprenoid-binding protein YceI